MLQSKIWFPLIISITTIFLTVLRSQKKQDIIPRLNILNIINSGYFQSKSPRAQQEQISKFECETIEP